MTFEEFKKCAEEHGRKAKEKEERERLEAEKKRRKFKIQKKI